LTGPNAYAGDDVTTGVSTSVYLDGSASFDPDDWPNALTYEWGLVTVPAGSAVDNNDLTDFETAYPYFTPDMRGTYVFWLMVNDSQYYDFDNVAITVGSIKGDMNKDGTVDISDVIRVLRMALGLDADDPCADINGDSIVDISDVIRTLRMALGLDDYQMCI
jgi:hypothetical protein